MRAIRHTDTPLKTLRDAQFNTVWFPNETGRETLDEAIRHGFWVVPTLPLPAGEWSDRRPVRPDPETLAMLSQKTGGLSLTLANLGRLADEFPGGDERREPISSRLEDAWDRWATLLCALGVLSLEWILRKRAELL